MSITTKTGDEGYTSLLNNKRVLKDDPILNLIGDIDELSSYLGLIKSTINELAIKDELSQIQQNISNIMAQAASQSKDEFTLKADNLKSIEKQIVKYESMYVAQNKFILPGDNELSATIDVGRAIARKAERSLISVIVKAGADNLISDINRKYFNRISDYLYALARYIDFKEAIALKVKEYLNEQKSDSNILSIREAKKLSLALAKELMEKVEAKADQIGISIVVAISNEWGNTIAVHFMDGALPGSYDIAINKAYTSAALRMSTLELGELAIDGMPLQGINNTNNNKIVIFGGGYPLKIKNIVVGAIGVSGGSANQDSELALYGAKLMEKFN